MAFGSFCGEGNGGDLGVSGAFVVVGCVVVSGAVCGCGGKSDGGDDFFFLSQCVGQGGGDGEVMVGS